MKDFRLTWLKYLAPSSGMIIVVPQNFNPPTLQDLSNQFDNNFKIRIFHEGNHSAFFLPLSKQNIKHMRINKIVYLVNSRESSRRIHRKMQIVGQQVTAEYSVLPDWRNPKWFVPRDRIMGLSYMPRIMSPTRLIARMGMEVFKMLRNIGYEQFLFPSRVIITQKSSSTAITSPLNNSYDLYQLCNEIEKFVKPGIMFTGQYGPHQNFTLEMLRNDNQSIAYVKFGHKEYSNKFLKHEHSILENLGPLLPATVKIPVSLGIRTLKISGDTVHIQKKLEGGKPVKGISSLIVQALSDLFVKTRQRDMVSVDQYGRMICKTLERMKEMNLSSEYSTICTNVILFVADIGNRLHSTKIPLSLSHGDFTRWNIRADSDVIYVIDWEEAAMRPPGYDLLSFLFAENLLAQQMEPEKVVQEFLKVSVKENSGFCHDFFSKTLGGCYSDHRIFVFLYLAETISNSLSFIEEINRLHYSLEKKHTIVLRTTWIALQRLYKSICDSYS